MRQTGASRKRQVSGVPAMSVDFEAVLAPFYREALTVRAGASPTPVLQRLLAARFRSLNGNESKDKATLMAQVEGFWKLIPDLRWEPQDKIVEGNKAVIRSVATGSPKGPFMGMTLDGSRSFCIDTIDVHTVENGQIVEVHHLEDWATAMRQLRG
jgi:predicted ester cyclase